MNRSSSIDVARWCGLPIMALLLGGCEEKQPCKVPGCAGLGQAESGGQASGASGGDGRGGASTGSIAVAGMSGRSSMTVSSATGAPPRVGGGVADGGVTASADALDAGGELADLCVRAEDLLVQRASAGELIPAPEQGICGPRQRQFLRENLDSLLGEFMTAPGGAAALATCLLDIDAAGRFGMPLCVGAPAD